VVDLPVEFFLQGDHAEKNHFGSFSGSVEQSASGNLVGDERSREESGSLIDQTLNIGGKFGAVHWKRQIRRIRGIEFRELLPRLCSKSSPYASCVFVPTHLL